MTYTKRTLRDDGMWLSSLYRGRELTEIEAAAKLAYTANGGLTMRVARDLIRNPWKWDSALIMMTRGDQ